MKHFEEYLSPIKLNLFLEVIKKTSDGYHQLESLMIFCKFGDFIKIKKSNKFLFSIEGPFSENLSTRQNIIIDTVSLLENFFGMKFNIEIVLKKNLPISSGMGGGSSNAATVFHCLKNLYNLKIKKKDLDELLFSLGADVPFCYYRKSAMVKGKGEKIFFLNKKIRELPVVLVNPLIEISTKQIFENLNLNKNYKNKFEYNDIDKANFFNYLEEKKNDLQPSAEIICPKIKEISDFLKVKTNAKFSRMTGSGATCFSIYENKDDAIKAERILRSEFKKIWIKRTELTNEV